LVNPKASLARAAAAEAVGTALMLAIVVDTGIMGENSPGETLRLPRECLSF